MKITPVPLLLVALAWFCGHAGSLARGGDAQAVDSVLYVSVQGGEAGGGDKKAGGLVEVRQENESIAGVHLLNQAPILRPYKVAISASGKQIAMAAGDSDMPAVCLFRPGQGEVGRAELKGGVSDLTYAGEQLIIAASKGLFYRLGSEGAIEAEFSARELLSPPGRKGEHIRILPNEETAVVSFQKDDDDSEAQGNRLVVIDIGSFRPQADVALPRDKPDLHLGDDPKEQGPGPEVIVVFPDLDTLAVSLDLYGGIFFCSLEGLLKGELRETTFVSTGWEGRLGTAFPDRLLGFEWRGQWWLLVSNASPTDGFALLDISKRTVVARFPAAGGAEMPVLQGGRICTVLSGKTKRRMEGEVSKETLPRPELMVFELGDPAEVGPIVSTAVYPLPFDPVNIQPADRELLWVTGRTPEGGVVALVRAADGHILTQLPLPGEPVRALSWRDADP